MDWEYRCMEQRTEGFWGNRLPDRCFIDLNSLGKEGWELIQSIPHEVVFGRTDRVSFILRRELQ